MRIRVWTGNDYEQVEIPDDLLRPLVEQLTMHRDWDRDLSRLGRLVNRTRLDITDYLLLEAQAKQRAAREAAAGPTPAQARMAKARAAKVAKREALAET